MADLLELVRTEQAPRFLAVRTGLLAEAGTDTGEPGIITSASCRTQLATTLPNG